MDPRGGADGIADARGAVGELPGAAEGRYAALLAARELTATSLDALRAQVDEALLPPRSAVVLFGSWGRHELTTQSDDDWALIVDDEGSDRGDPAIEGALAHLEAVFDARPGRQGYFGTAFAARPLRERIGLDEDDTRNLTRRMLLLLEAEAVTGPAVLRGVQDGILERYLEYHHSSWRPPRFLLNDLIRYWRTICVDFEGKAEQDRREGTGQDKFAMRIAKLRTSRKMLFASGMLPVLLCRFVEDPDVAPLLRTQLDARATDRVARAFLHLGQPDAGGRTLAAYGQWIGILGDPDRRAALTGGDRRVRSEVERIGESIDNGLTSLLFESALAEIARRYTVL